MIALIQRVKCAQVAVHGQTVGQINQGVLAFIGVEKSDTSEQVSKLANRLLGYRIFSDDDDKMNLSVKDIHGDVLLVSQFTLAADTRKGARPSFSSAAPPDVAQVLFDECVKHIQNEPALNHVATGQFGADMQVHLTNDGPVTFHLKV